jgi:hypothetical protein
VFEQMPGSHKVCPICCWEDNLVQLRFPLMPGASNVVSLETAQQNYQQFGSAEKRKFSVVRRPRKDERKDESWRLLDQEVDNVEEPQAGIDYVDSYPTHNTSVLYYWRDTYWRSSTA